MAFQYLVVRLVVVSENGYRVIQGPLECCKAMRQSSVILIVMLWDFHPHFARLRDLNPCMISFLTIWCFDLLLSFIPSYSVPTTFKWTVLYLCQVGIRRGHCERVLGQLTVRIHHISVPYQLLASVDWQSDWSILDIYLCMLISAIYAFRLPLLSSNTHLELIIKKMNNLIRLLNVLFSKS